MTIDYNSAYYAIMQTCMSKIKVRYQLLLEMITEVQDNFVH